jgi:serine/threonine-protein kinase
MLRDEAVALRKLVDTQNTSRMLSYGLEDGWHCMALEYVTGVTVSALLRVGPVSLPKALDIISQVCYGLNNFHQQGLVHMDVKPGNILVGENNQSTLIDGGNAAPFPTQPAKEIKVTLNFCSPEQISGESADHRSDIYNLGLTLFSMLTGRHPFVGSHFEKAIQIKSSEVPMLPDTFHPQVRAIVGRMTAHDPANRYQDVMDIVRDIRAFIETQ